MKKILIINNNYNKGYINNVVKPLIKLQEKRNTFHITIKSGSVEYSDYSKYDYVVFEGLSVGCIGQVEGQNKPEFIYYVDEWWQLPKSHPLHKKYNENNIHNKIKSIITSSDAIVTYGNDLLVEEIKKLNKNVIQIKRVDGYTNIKLDTKQPVFGVVPTENDLLNIKQLSKLDSLPNTFWKNVKIVLVGFTTISSVYNKVERCFIDVVNYNNIWVEYERIITNNYKICSEEYKEFLHKFLPNDKYKGDINIEPYKRIWKNEIDDDTIYYNILLKPLIKNKYNQLSYDIESDMAKNTIIDGKYVQVLNTIDYPKLNIEKNIKNNMLKMALECRQSVIFPAKKKINYRALKTLLEYLKK